SGCRDATRGGSQRPRLPARAHSAQKIGTISVRRRPKVRPIRVCDHAARQTTLLARAEKRRRGRVLGLSLISPQLFFSPKRILLNGDKPLFFSLHPARRRSIVASPLHCTIVAAALAGAARSAP